jgi:hypothetical protein
VVATAEAAEAYGSDVRNSIMVAQGVVIDAAVTAEMVVTLLHTVPDVRATFWQTQTRSRGCGCPRFDN